MVRRGFTIRLKRLKPRAPDFGGPQNFERKNNFIAFLKALHFRTVARKFSIGGFMFLPGALHLCGGGLTF